MKFFLKIVAAIALFGYFVGLNSNPAVSMTFYEQKVDTANGPIFILHMNGDINLGDTEAMVRFLYGVIVRYKITTSPASVVSLNSNGGSVVEAIKMAEMFRKSRQAVMVDNGNSCASACFLLFAAGVPHSAAPNAFIAIHSASNSRGETFSSAAATVVFARVLGGFGVPSDIIGKLVQTEPNQIYRLTISDLTAMGTNILNAPQATRPAVAPNRPPAATASQVAPSLGPSFNCNKPTLAPLARMICGDSKLALIDLRFVQAYMALYHQVGIAGRPQLRQEDLAFINETIQLCGVSDNGVLIGSADCVGARYDAQRVVWASRLRGPATLEAARPLEQHFMIMARLQSIGFYPAAEKIDGVYGVGMRTAITQWQTQNDKQVTGFLSAEDVNDLLSTDKPS